MAEHDPLSGLHELARVGEEYAHPIPADRVRRLGQQRRTRRRIGVVAAAVAATVAIAGAAWTTNLPRTDDRTDVVASPNVPPTPTATAAHSPSASRPPQLTETSLLTAQEVGQATAGGPDAVSKPSLGRAVHAASVCLPAGGWESLGATTVLTRNFRDSNQAGAPTRGPLPNVPRIYTAVAQFASEEKAGEAVARYRGWLSDCAAQLQQRNWEVAGSKTTAFVPVRSGADVVGEYAVVPNYYPPEFENELKQPSGDGGPVNEYVGLLRVGDRVMVIVTLYVANTAFQSDQPGGDPEQDLPPNDQFGLVRAGAVRLAGRPAPTASGQRRALTGANLVSAKQIPVRGPARYAETPADAGRRPKQLTLCRPEDGDTAIGAKDVLSRNFRMTVSGDGESVTSPPFGTDPTIYTQALQFASPAEAQRAYEAYRRWLRSCSATLESLGHTPAGGDDQWYPVGTDATTTAGFGEIVWRPAGEQDAGYFESVGLAVVGDRLAVTVSLIYGQDYNVSLEENTDPNGAVVRHPQFDLVKAAAARLAR